MPLAVNAQHFLLTYAHVEGNDDNPELDPFRIVDVLGAKGAECIVAREFYPNTGGFHFHVFCSFERNFRSRKADVFDVDGYHPNIEPSRKNAAGGFDYATKDGDIVAGGLERPSRTRGRTGTTGAQATWGEITAAESAEEFWRLCEELDPKSMVCNFPALSKFAEWRFRPIPVPYASPDGVFDTSGYPIIEEWRTSVFDEYSGRGESYTYLTVQPTTRHPLPSGGPSLHGCYLQPVRFLIQSNQTLRWLKFIANC
ncbi:RepA [Pacific flying fox faeces associated gemycircularvirus-10]|uniref:RepA n=1 Tax=Pacific flying fox faeces associated gemycircularvirus-10 TaxID=1795989 RepID=A0A140CTP9_9VIRU|nr:RepA [Pacific flying fox faeces associated gemycircularvirus-10]